MQIGTQITLSATEQRICKHIADARFANSRSCQVVNNKIGKQSNEFTDLNGFGAELAFCKMTNVYPDLTIAMKSAGKGSDLGDVILPGGLRVDVKSTRYASGKLVASTSKLHTVVDLFALMVGIFPTFTFRGCMARKDLIHPGRLGTLGYGPTYLATQQELGPLPCFPSFNTPGQLHG